MIQKLIQRVVELLRDAFSGKIADPAAHILADGGQAPEPKDLPIIRVFAGDLSIEQEARESRSSQPRPQELREEIAVDPANPGGPYTLSKTPLEGSMRCTLIKDRGQTSERRVPIVEGSGFAVDYRNLTISFLADVSGGSVLALEYSFAGVFTISEFRQEMLIDFFDATVAAIETWMSLSATIILTHHDELLAHYNFTDKTEYIADRFVSSHSIDHIDMTAGKPDASGTIPRMRLAFKVQGQIKSTREISDGFGIIRKIRSPGRVSDYPIDVEVDLD